MLGCRCGECGHDRGRVDLQYYVGYQLLGQLAEEGVAERGEFDDQGFDVSAKAVVLGHGHDAEAGSGHGSHLSLRCYVRCAYYTLSRPMK